MKGILIIPVEGESMREICGRRTPKACIHYPSRTVYIRRGVGRHFPSWRRYVLWHEWQHFRFFERWGMKRKWPHHFLDITVLTFYVPWRLLPRGLSDPISEENL